MSNLSKLLSLVCRFICNVLTVLSEMESPSLWNMFVSLYVSGPVYVNVVLRGAGSFICMGFCGLLLYCFNNLLIVVRVYPLFDAMVYIVLSSLTYATSSNGVVFNLWIMCLNAASLCCVG